MAEIHSLIDHLHTKTRATMIDSVRVDMAALEILTNLCNAALTVADAFKDTGRTEAAGKIYDGVATICDAHQLIIAEIKPGIRALEEKGSTPQQGAAPKPATSGVS